MSKTLSTNALIESVSLRASLPVTQSTFQEADFLYFINEEIDLGVVPHVMSFHEDYFLYTEEIPLEVGKQRYSIPSRAIGNKLRDVALKDSADNWYEMTRITVGDNPGRLEVQYGSIKQFYLEGDEIVLPDTVNSSAYSLVVSYYLRPNQVVSENDACRITSINRRTGVVSVDQAPSVFLEGALYDITSNRTPFKTIGINLSPIGVPSTGSLSFTFGTEKIYNSSFNSPIPLGFYYQIIDRTATDVGVTYYFWLKRTALETVPTELIGLDNVVEIDISAVYTIGTLPTSTCHNTISLAINTIFTDSRITTEVESNILRILNGGAGVAVGDTFSASVSDTSNSLSLISEGTNTIPQRAAINDVIALAEQTIIPQVPVELHSMLAQRVAMRCLESMGDSQGLQNAAAKLADMEQKTGMLIDNRVEDAPLKITSKHSNLRRRRNSFYRR